MAREEAEVAAGGRACSLTTVHCGATILLKMSGFLLFYSLVREPKPYEESNEVFLSSL